MVGVDVYITDVGDAQGVEWRSPSGHVIRANRRGLSTNLAGAEARAGTIDSVEGLEYLSGLGFPGL